MTICTKTIIKNVLFCNNNLIINIHHIYYYTNIATFYSYIAFSRILFIFIHISFIICSYFPYFWLFLIFISKFPINMTLFFEYFTFCIISFDSYSYLHRFMHNHIFSKCVITFLFSSQFLQRLQDCLNFDIVIRYFVLEVI